MASAQGGAVRKEEAFMEELTKQSNPQTEMLFAGYMYNKSNPKKPMHLHADKIWSGEIYKDYNFPEVLDETDERASFALKADWGDVIKSAVVYSLKTGEHHFNHYAFLLAWSYNFVQGRRVRKVYVRCGLLENFSKINWENVEKELDASTPSSSYIDALTRTSVKAHIDANVVYADFM
ncbi:hypothetical protein SOVF_064950 [Spinacia oleracea]|uniref:Jasmonate-induced protein homolog n=1 Tax=Spinacia oleracea TaxID=3562 RepID=A0A9R0IGF4_SPIOL|nr:jasmonate-induced protein homolog [Spinacia oleracea]KNA19066.1 hypothetical protein SOVF_064950 [Spinacia oleracea]